VKTAAQLKAKSRNLAAQSGTPPHIIQRNFLFERFLNALRSRNTATASL
jgi:hypothetical protein